LLEHASLVFPFLKMFAYRRDTLLFQSLLRRPFCRTFITTKQIPSRLSEYRNNTTHYVNWYQRKKLATGQLRLAPSLTQMTESVVLGSDSKTNTLQRDSRCNYVTPIHTGLAQQCTALPFRGTLMTTPTSKLNLYSVHRLTKTPQWIHKVGYATDRWPPNRSLVERFGKLAPVGFIGLFGVIVLTPLKILALGGALGYGLYRLLNQSRTRTLGDMTPKSSSWQRSLTIEDILREVFQSRVYTPGTTRPSHAPVGPGIGLIFSMITQLVRSLLSPIKQMNEVSQQLQQVSMDHIFQAAADINSAESRLLMRVIDESDLTSLQCKPPHNVSVEQINGRTRIQIQYILQSSRSDMLAEVTVIGRKTQYQTVYTEDTLDSSDIQLERLFITSPYTGMQVELPVTTIYDDRSTHGPDAKHGQRRKSTVIDADYKVL
jgi:hypothetical protein